MLHIKTFVYICINKQTNNTVMATQNTTPANQTKLVAFAKQLGITIESLERMYQDPVKASFLNVIAQGL